MAGQKPARTLTDKTENKTGGRGGRRPGSGRKKGSPNKLTADVKQAIYAAFDKVGGVQYLVDVAKTNPQVFCTLLGKLIPYQVSNDPESPITGVQITVIDPSAE